MRKPTFGLRGALLLVTNVVGGPDQAAENARTPWTAVARALRLEVPAPPPPPPGLGAAEDYSATDSSGDGDGDDGEWPECYVCMDRRANVCNLPCGCVALCTHCAEALPPDSTDRQRCGQCRQELASREIMRLSPLFARPRGAMLRCQMCGERPPQTMVLPCMHAVLCGHCAERARHMRVCVCCDQPITEVVS